MPLKKIEWGDIPNEIYVKEKDDLRKWIECNICHLKIRIRSQFCFIEWQQICILSIKKPGQEPFFLRFA